MNKKEPGSHNRNGKIGFWRYSNSFDAVSFPIWGIFFLFFSFPFFSCPVLSYFLYIYRYSILFGAWRFFFFFDWDSPHFFFFPFSPLFQPSLFGFFWFLSFGSSAAGSHGDLVMGIGICGVSLVQYIILPLVCLGWG